MLEIIIKILIILTLFIFAVGFIYAGYWYQYDKLPELDKEVNDLYEKWKAEGRVGHVNGLYRIIHGFFYTVGVVFFGQCVYIVFRKDFNELTSRIL